MKPRINIVTTLTTIALAIAILTACNNTNTPDRPDTPETAEIAFTMMWQNNLTIELKLSTDITAADGIIAQPVSATLRPGETVAIASAKKAVTVDTDNTRETREREILASIINSLTTVELSYIIDHKMYSYRGKASDLIGNTADYIGGQDTKTLSITPELLSSADITVTEGKPNTVAIHWQNTFTLPITISITAPENTLTKQLQPTETLKLTDLQYYTYSDDDDRTALLKAMSDYYESLQKIILTLPTLDENGEWTTTGYDVTKAHETLFTLDNYRRDAGLYTLELYNRLLYAELDWELSAYLIGCNKYKTELQVFWKNGMTEPMDIEIKYREHKIYIVGPDIITHTIRPGETFQMPDFVIYSDDTYTFLAHVDVSWNAYTSDIETLTISCGDLHYNLATDGKRDFINHNAYNSNHDPESMTYTFTPQSFTAK